MQQDLQSPARLTRRMRGTLITVGIFSAVINILMLASPLYMMQVFDRVVASRSWDTLVYLTALALAALAVMAAVDTLRGRLMTRVGEWLERQAGNDAFYHSVLRTPGGRTRRGGDEALRDVSRVRAFMTSPAILALFDVPWMPLYFILTFMLHPVLGWSAVIGGVVLMGVAILGDVSTRRPTDVAGEAHERAMRIMNGAQRNAEALQAMGLAGSLAARWANAMDGAHTASRSAADRMALLSGLSKFLRFGLQIAVLGIGAWLTVEQQLTGGASIAASIIISRALGPIDHAIGSWRQVITAHQAWARLKSFLAVSGPPRRTALPSLRGTLECEHVTYCLPGIERPILRDVTIQVPAGRSLAIVGPSGSGKSTFARLLVGVLPPTAGTVRLDGADVFGMAREELGPQLGYLPQDVELFGGSIAENIARMEEPDDALVVTAARRARVHDMILRLPGGYESEVGEGGSNLSGGQRQRVGLARALYGEPRFLVLDEPNANLDIEGEEALVEALREQQPRGATVIMVTHRLNLVALADFVLVLREGTVEMFGPRDEVLARLRGPRPAPVPTEQLAHGRARPVASAGGAA